MTPFDWILLGVSGLSWVVHLIVIMVSIANGINIRYTLGVGDFIILFGLPLIVAYRAWG